MMCSCMTIVPVALHRRASETIQRAAQLIKVVRVNTFGCTSNDVEADKCIPTDKADTRQRRTVKLDRTKLSTSWGFTLQTYGILDKQTGCVENYTYVDYVEFKTPAFVAGMRPGDIIFAVNGQSTESLNHEELVDKVSSCRSQMRLVLINSNICRKIELYERRQKLQKLLRLKQVELKGLEKRELALKYHATKRAECSNNNHPEKLPAHSQKSDIPRLGYDPDVRSKHSSSRYQSRTDLGSQMNKLAIQDSCKQTRAVVHPQLPQAS